MAIKKHNEHSTKSTMRVCFIANSNSSHAQRWIQYFCQSGSEVFILSTAKDPEPIKGAKIFPLSTSKAFGFINKRVEKRSRLDVSLAEPAKNGPIYAMTQLAKILYENALITRLRSFYLIFLFTYKVKKILRELKPDLIHCINLPIEGYIGGLINYRPLIISSLGADFVFFANKYLAFRWLTKKALKKSDAHFADNIRDRYLAALFEFPPSKITAPIPGWGGLKLEEYHPYRDKEFTRKIVGIAPSTNVIFSSRDFRSPFVNTEALVRALPQTVEKFPDTLCILIGDTRSIGYPKLKKLTEELNVQQYCRFIHRLEHVKFMDYLAASDILVSVSLYDGCSVSMIEGMACGVIPVVSNDFPKTEWVAHDWNGYLFDPTDQESITKTIIEALDNKASSDVMRQRNWKLVEEKADYHTNMKIAEEIYRSFVDR